MTFLKSNLCKNAASALIFSTFLLFASCGDGTQSSGSASGDSSQVSGTDTTHTGLEGTQEQSASLSTDVKSDTSSGQTSKMKQKDSTSTGDSARKK
jgi:hypothetical protein